MAKEIIQEYLACDIDPSEPFGRERVGLACRIEGNSAGVHPQVRLGSNGVPVFGRIESITPNGKQCRVATRGSNMVFDVGIGINNAEDDTSDIGAGILCGDDGLVQAGGQGTGRGVAERGVIIGGTNSKLRVDFDNS